jgi:hypothetical protein
MVSNRDEVRRALWSVHFHHYFSAGSQPLPKDIWDQVRPIPLVDAVSILRAAAAVDQGVVGKQLAYMRVRDAWILHPDQFDTPPPLPDGDPERVMKLYKLDYLPARPEAKAKYQKLVRGLQPPDFTDASQVPIDPLGEIPSIHPAFRVQEYVPNTGWFDLQNHVCDIVSHSSTNSMSALWSIDVNRPFRSMLAVLDPRNWDHCSAYVEVATSQDGRPQCPLNDPGPPADSGSDWKDYFCERLGTGFSSGLTFGNRLYFTFTNQAPGTITTFSDRDPAGNQTGLDPLIEFDRGWVAAGPAPDDPSFTRIRGYKFLRFTQPWLRTVAVPLMESWISEEVRTGTACALP